MTKEELIEKLKLLQNSSDPEAAHSDAEDLLLEFIADEEIRKEYEEVPKWYA